MPDAPDMTVLACMAKPADRELAARILTQAGLEHRLCADLEALLNQARQGAGVLLIEQELLSEQATARLSALLADQPTWSDLPVVVLLSRRAPLAAAARYFGPWGRNVTMLERPTPSASLVSVLRTSLEARRRQYEVRDLLASLRELTDTLERRVKERTQELARSNLDLEQFAYIASHDLGEPLRMVTGFMGLLKSRYGDRLDDEGREFIGFAVDGAKRMEELLGGLLAYSRISTKGRKPGPVSMQEAYEKAVANLRRSIQETGAEVTADELPAVRADQTQMTQLLQNLIGNAIKFRREGTQPRVHVSAEPHEDNKWLFSVADNGIGIDPAQAERVFDVFQRLHTREQYKGTGVGLAICKKILQRHGGRIWVQSTPGGGSTFLFTLPKTD